MTTVDPLLELAGVREEMLALEGQNLLIVEPSALVNMEYRFRRVKSMAEGIAYLISECVLDPETRKPRWTLEEARIVANGRATIFTPIVTLITGFLAREKKVSPPPSGPTTA